ncbi:MAG: hypothetical protein KAR19_07105 [Bacteroidales bacterium]|nr:hypothetical protein [Bacteroidales bacterium]
MRFSLQPEQRPEHRMHTVSIDEILTLGERDPESRPPLENYFSPTRREAFTKDYLHYLNSGLLDAKHGKLDSDQYLVFVLSFQFTAPLLEIPAEKELGLFYRILQKTYKVDEIDLNLHFSLDQLEEEMVDESEALATFRHELEETYKGFREVKQSVQKRLKRDAIESIMLWQKDHTLPALAEAFGRSIVIPSFFSFVDKKLVSFYRGTTEGITYRVAVPEEID